jgi:hypothetical protein
MRGEAIGPSLYTPIPHRPQGQTCPHACKYLVAPRHGLGLHPGDTVHHCDPIAAMFGKRLVLSWPLRVRIVT